MADLPDNPTGPTPDDSSSRPGPDEQSQVTGPDASSDPGDLAHQLAEEEEGHYRHLHNWTRWLVPILGICWSLFQLAIASFWELDSVYVRCVHLGFALCICYLEIPLLKHAWGEGWITRKLKALIPASRVTALLERCFRFLWRRDKLSIPDIFLAVIATLAALYLMLDYERIVGLSGLPTTRDIVIGLVLLVLLMEASRRAIGPALAVVAGGFIAYAFLAERLPHFLAFKAPSLNRFMGQMTLTTEGIYGIPLDVSAKMVFLFVLFGAMLEKAGGGRFFINLALSLLGWMRGGPAKAAVLASGLTGMISGSSIANIVTTGTFSMMSCLTFTIIFFFSRFI